MQEIIVSAMYITRHYVGESQHNTFKYTIYNKNLYASQTKATKNISFLDSIPALKNVGSGNDEVQTSTSLNLRTGCLVDNWSASSSCGLGNWCVCNTSRTNANNWRNGFVLSKRRVKVFPCGVLTLHVITPLSPTAGSSSKLIS